MFIKIYGFLLGQNYRTTTIFSLFADHRDIGFSWKYSKGTPLSVCVISRKINVPVIRKLRKYDSGPIILARQKSINFNKHHFSLTCQQQRGNLIWYLNKPYSFINFSFIKSRQLSRVGKQLHSSRWSYNFGQYCIFFFHDILQRITHNNSDLIEKWLGLGAIYTSVINMISYFLCSTFI
jgi:hypothetical protein